MKQELQQAVQDAAQQLFNVDQPVELSRPEEKFGDYATNVALQLSKQLGRPPREIAEELADKLRGALADTVAEVTIAGPGFINLRLTDMALASAASALPATNLLGQTIVMDYSDPNPFKPLHAGHLYTTLVGDTIARLLEHGGARVIRTNYGGDVGLHVGKAMWGIIQNLGGELPEKLQDIPEADRPTWLGARYVAGNSAYEAADETGATAQDQANKQAIVDTNKRVYELHAHDEHHTPFAQIYWTCRQWSYDYFDTLYEQLDVTPFERYFPESEVTPLGYKTVRDQLAKGVYRESEGAVIFDGEAAGHGLHTRVFINSAGLPTYETKDVGLLLTKWRDYHFDTSIVITDRTQAQYMEVMLASVAQFEPEPAERSLHLTHGTLKLIGGVKMSSRKGNTLLALDILTAARQAAEALAAANVDAKGNSETGTQGVDKDTVLAAVKYAFAKNRIGGDIIYDPAESIALEGNSGPYLQYAHARARSILAKAATPAASLMEADLMTDSAEEAIMHEAAGSEDLQPDERSLLRKISEYAEVVDKSVAELMPHYICTYLYELAQTFNRFYEHNRVIGDDRETFRLQLVTRYADTLKAGLELLGITAPERM